MPKRSSFIVQDTPTPRFVTERDLAELTSIKVRTWQKFRLLNEGPRWFKLRGSVRYRLDEVLAWIESKASDTSNVQ